MQKTWLCALLLWSLGIYAAGTNSLFDAINAGDLATVVSLLESGADVNARDADYMNATPLMVAMGKNDLELTELLLEAGADINAIDENGDPAINWAAYYGLTDQVKLLLDHGASAQLVGHGNALDIAMRRGHQELVLALVENQGFATGLTAAALELQAAIDDGDIQAAEGAISRGAEAQGLDETGRPFIARAARNGNVEMVLLLKANGAKIDAQDPIGFTPLMEVAREGNVVTSEILLQEGADPNHVAFKRGLSFTPLHQAAVGGHVTVLAALLNADAQLDRVDSMGNTAAMWALFEGKTVACLALLEAGANPNIRNESDMSLASVAREYQVNDVVAWLDANNPD